MRKLKMGKKTDHNEDIAKLRRRAEEQVGKKTAAIRKKTANNLEEVINELNLHQIELEIQSEEMRQVQLELEKSRSKYADLYDYAPIGYFTIDKHGFIIEANLSGCQMLGVERSSLIKKPFHLYVDRDNKDDFYLHRMAALTPGVKLTCEITIVRKDKEKFQARLDSIPVIDEDGNVNGCRTTITDISEQKHAQQQVVNLAKFPAEDPFPVLRISEDGKIIYNNKPAESLLAEWHCEISQKAPLKWRKIVSESLRTNECRVIDVHFGETIFSITFAPVPEGGYVNLYCTDITERKKAEDALRRSQQMLSELIERSPFGTYVVDSQFCIAHMNTSSQNGAFRNVRPVIGRPFNEAMHILWPDDLAEEIIAHFRHSLETGEPYYSPQFINPRHDVTIVESYEWELHRMTLPDGQYGVICYYFDSTKLREAETALRESEGRFRALTETSSLAVGVSSPDGKFLYINKAYEKLFGYTLKELNHVNASELWRNPEDRRKMIDDVRSKGFLMNYEVELMRKDGTLFWAVLSVNSVDYGGIQAIMASVYDITERKKAEEEIMKSNEELSRFNKYAVGRELRMLELKKEINSHCEAMGQPARYKVDFDSESNKYEKKQTSII